MEIVIKISDEDYKAIAKGYLPYGAIADAIRNGKPLPEHHGRLIDEQQIIDRFKPVEKFKDWRIGLDGLSNVLSDAPTIIEADKGE